MSHMNVVYGAMAGAAIGGLLTAAFGAMEDKKHASQNLGVDNIEFLLADSQLSELLSRFKPLSKHSAELLDLYNNMVTSCNELIKIYVNPGEHNSKGAMHFKANRLATRAKNNAISLCKLSFSKYKDETSPELLREIDNLEGLCNNHLHNIMIS